MRCREQSCKLSSPWRTIVDLAVTSMGVRWLQDAGNEPDRFASETLLSWYLVYSPFSLLFMSNRGLIAMLKEQIAGLV